MKSTAISSKMKMIIDAMKDAHTITKEKDSTADDVTKGEKQTSTTSPVDVKALNSRTLVDGTFTKTALHLDLLLLWYKLVYLAEPVTF